jgi:rhomboid protease GluP
MSIVLLISVIVAATTVARKAINTLRLPWLTGATCLLLAFCFAAQLAWPDLLPTVQRSQSAIQAGQPYRLLTSLWFQDGGVAGGIFNIAVLAVVGTFGEQVFSRPLWLAIYLTGGLISEVVALSWQPVGAGNSVAYMSLAGALLGLALQRPSRSDRIVAGLGLGAGLLLCLRTDIHGAAVAIGCGLLVVTQIGSGGRGLRKPA